MLITSSDTVVPYSKDTLFSNMYPYEGMTSGLGPQPENSTESNATTTANKAFQEYANQNVKPPNPLSSSEISSIMKTFGVSADASQSGSDKPKESKKVEGFALQPAAFADSKIIDIFGETPAGPQCFGNSGGYSKSLGPLCMTPNQIKLLSTRGGNISGNDSTIGR